MLKCFDRKTLKGKRQIERPRSKRQNNTETGLKERGCESVN
jgi:hypothetical protein